MALSFCIYAGVATKPPSIIKLRGKVFKKMTIFSNRITRGWVESQPQNLWPKVKLMNIDLHTLLRNLIAKGLMTDEPFLPASKSPNPLCIVNIMKALVRIHVASSPSSFSSLFFDIRSTNCWQVQFEVALPSSEVIFTVVMFGAHSCNGKIFGGFPNSASWADKGLKGVAGGGG